MLRPSQRREMARWAVENGRTSIRHACQTFALSEIGYRYQAKASAENARIADWLVRLTTAYRDWGSDCAFCTCATSRATAGITNGSTASTGSWN
jgi:putative transposase